ncbi:MULTISPECIES: UDP-N-acetylglucosamine 2-epimerase [Oceanotoga]|uniref:UDP-N-acetylglucosamine 2-epimerase n=1 Tax=Oceanotoga TaxID=1255275 RepID=UPI00264EECE1|nr:MULTISPECIES: UDP-N-acetylglucosamine 2-epimerase [Oceanotoga]MDN5342782.1 hypothetical protein [Oceanotoga sp.]MDO7975803.1 UDP-N-acetylglucosamine 2-epimerase [Oceanotoga teriensis]
MKKILFFTSARSDYGLLKPLIKISNNKFDTYLLVSGSHFLSNKGFTYKEIEEDMILDQNKIFKINSFNEKNDNLNLCINIGNSIKDIGKFFEDNYFDCIILLGDRYELFSVTFPALMYKIPIFHISGGEITEGVIDDSVRHATTKLSHVHLVANKDYAKNVSLMGEEDWRICITGENGLDNIHSNELASKEEILEKFDIDLNKKSILVTYHPSTLENLSPFDQVTPILNILKKYSRKYQLIFTGCGNEKGSDIIENEIKKFVDINKNCFFISHFGIKNYLKVLQNSSMVLGNSSSGIVEAPSFSIPTINVGNRQLNRLSAESVLHCNYDENEIEKNIKIALSKEFKNKILDVYNPYDPYKDGKNSERIAIAIKNALSLDKNKLITKKFINEIDQEKWNYLLEE